MIIFNGQSTQKKLSKIDAAVNNGISRAPQHRKAHIGSYSFRDFRRWHCRIGGKKNGVHCQTRNIRVVDRYWTEIWFSGKSGPFLSRENIPGAGRGGACVTPAKWFKHIRAGAQDGTRTTKTCYQPQITEPSGFPSDFCASDDVPRCKSCRRGADWQCVDTCNSCGKCCRAHT